MKMNVMVSVLLTVALAMSAMAERVVVVRKLGSDKTGIDLSGVSQGAGETGLLLVRTIQKDLENSGWFTIAPPKSGVIQVSGRTAGGIQMDCRVVNAADGRSYLSKQYQGSPEQAVVLAHRIADDIVFAVKGVKGIASTRIAMIGASGRQKDLYICYAGGGPVTQLTRDGAPCMSPDWTPDGNGLFYTSMKGGYPDIYKIDLGSKLRRPVCRYPGLNDGASVSPDGSAIAMTLSKDGNPELYVKDLGSGTLKRLTVTRDAAEASPTWSPDGSSIAYVSDVSGSPQIYVTSRSGGGARRITRVGGQNVSPDWGPDGRIAYAGLRGGVFQICLTTASGGPGEQLTKGGGDHEEPSWAPDGRHIVYARAAGRRSSLYVLDTLGDPEVRLTNTQGDWYSPAWSSR